MVEFKAEVAHGGVTHKGLWRLLNGQVKTRCGKTLADGTYKDRNRIILDRTDCPDCLSVR